MTLYKTLNGTAGAYGYGCWSLPTLNPDGTYTPGEWMVPVKPVLCKSGYHYCRDLSEVVIHLASDIYELEPADLETTMRIARECGTEWDPSWPIVYEGDDKIVHACGRLTRRLWADTWTPEAQVLFAADCARMVADLAPDLEMTYARPGIMAARAALAAREAAKDASWKASLKASWKASWKADRRASRAGLDAARGAAREAELATLSQQTALLERYLAGEQGPLVERETS
jgi:hypothetical protein